MGEGGPMDLDFSITVQYEDLSDVWSSVCRSIESKLPLRDVHYINKLGAAVAIDKVPVRLIDRSHPSLRLLQRHARSPAVWFRQPFVSLVTISCDDADDYKRNFRLQLRAMIDPEVRDPLGPEPVFVYVSPANADIDAKGPARVVDAMRRELGSRKRDRVARLDPPPTSDKASEGHVWHGTDALMDCVKTALVVALEARAAAYAEQTRRQLTTLQASVSMGQGPSFIDFFLSKDSLAVMMEAAGLIDDALRELLELEVACLQHEMQRQAEEAETESLQSLLLVAGDEAGIMWGGWKDARAIAAGVEGSHPSTAPPMASLALRQALFANQARVLLKLRRYTELLEKGLAFLQQAAPAVRSPHLLRECWIFAGSLELAYIVKRDAFNAQGRKGDESATTLQGEATINPASWKLGSLHPVGLPLPSPRRDGVPVDASFANPALSKSSIYCALGELYYLARDQLEILGRQRKEKLQPPTLIVDLAAISAQVVRLRQRMQQEEDRGVATPASKQPYSPRLSASARARSLSPIRNSIDRNTVYSASRTSQIGEIGKNDPSVLIPNGASPSARNGAYTQGFEGAEGEQLQTIELSAAMSSTSMTEETSQHVTGELGHTEIEVVSAGTLQPSGTIPGKEGIEKVTSTRTEAQANEELPARSFVDSKVSIRTRRPSESESSGSTPRASSVGMTFSAVGGVRGDASGATSPSPSPIPAPLTGPLEHDFLSDYGSICQVESILVASERSSEEDKTPRLRSPSGSSTTVGLPFVVPVPDRTCAPGSDTNNPWEPLHWRLRAALTSQAAFTSLWIALADAAAECFEHGGRQRRALSCRLAAADAAAAAGHWEEARVMYDAFCGVALREGWSKLAFATLPKLVACQAAVGDSGLPHTAAILLALAVQENGTSSTASVASAMDLLLHVAAVGGFDASAHPRGRVMDPVIDGGDQYFIDLSAVCDMSCPADQYGRFYRWNAGATNFASCSLFVPASLVTTTDATSEGTAAIKRQLSYAQCAVGDVTTVTIRLVSFLPSALPLEDVCLELCGMQEVAVSPSSPRATSFSPDPFRHSLQPPNRHSLVAAPMTATGLGGLRMSSYKEEPSDKPVTEWIDVEILECGLVELSGQSDSGQGKNKGIGASILHPLRSAVHIQPGVNCLIFMVAPLKKGLYKPLHVTAKLGALPVKFSSSGSTLLAGADKQPGGIMKTSSHNQEPDTIVLEVTDASGGKVEVSSVSANGGMLLAGQRQWLGVQVTPAGRESLRAVFMTVGWPTVKTREAGRLGRKKSLLAQAASTTMPERQNTTEDVALISPQYRRAAITRKTSGKEIEQSTIVAIDPTPGETTPGDGCSSWTMALLADEDIIHPADNITAWLWVDAKLSTAVNSPAEPEIVRLGQHLHSGSFEYDHQGGLEGVGTPELTSTPLGEEVQVPLVLEYASGCRRAHTRTLPIQIHKPFVVNTAAQEVADGTILLQFRIHSVMHYAVELTGASVNPQSGVVLQMDAGKELALFPCRLPAGGSVSLAFMMTRSEGNPAGGRTCDNTFDDEALVDHASTLTLDYEIDHACSPAVSPAVGMKYTQTIPPVSALERLAAGLDSGTNLARQICSFTHVYSIELSTDASPESSASEASVLVQFIGPRTAVVGHPLPMCWRLERIIDVLKETKATADSGTEAMAGSRVEFEVDPGNAGGSWTPLGAHRGVVTLDDHCRALATVEAVWVPLVAGTLPVPSLRLKDLPYREAAAVSNEGNYVVVVPPHQQYGA